MGNGRSGKPTQEEIKQAFLDALREHGELDMNDLTMVALQLRPVLPEAPAGNLSEIIEALDDLEEDGAIVRFDEGAGPHRFKLAE